MTAVALVTSRRPAAPRTGPLAVEIAAMAAVWGLDTLLLVHPGGAQELRPALVRDLVSSLVPAAGVLALLRRRFPDRTGLLGAGVVVLPALTTLGVVVLAPAPAGPGGGGWPPAWPCATDTLAVALVVGAACRSLAPLPSAVLTATGGLVMAGGPVLRYRGTPWAPVGVAAALVWGVALGVGLLLRDADR